MLSAQIAFLADDKLDVLGDKIDTVSQLNPPRIGSTRKTRIDFDYDWAKLRPPEFNACRSPAKAESSQTVQRNIGDTLILIISQRSRKDTLTTDEVRWGAEVGGTNSNDLISHYLSAIIGPLCEFFDQYPRRRPPYVLPAQQIGRMLSYLIGVAAQSDTAAAGAYGWLKNHRQADLRGRAFYLSRI